MYYISNKEAYDTRPCVYSLGASDRSGYILGSGLMGKTFWSTCLVTFLVFSSSDISCRFFMENNVNLTIIFVLLCIRASSSLRNSPVSPSRTGYALMKHVPVLCGKTWGCWVINKSSDHVQNQLSVNTNEWNWVLLVATEKGGVGWTPKERNWLWLV